MTTAPRRLMASGRGRLLVETFTRDEAALFDREVIPALKQRNAAPA